MHRSGSEQLGLGKLLCKIYGAVVWVETVEVEVRSTARLRGIYIRVIHEVVRGELFPLLTPNGSMSEVGGVPL